MPRPPERNLLEATLQNIEVAVDAATANDVIASIPVIGTAFKICKAIDDIRARAFAAKLNGFVAEPGLSTPAAKAALAQKLRDSPDEARKVGETLFLVLDRFIDLYKPAILAKVFVAYLDNVVTARDLQRLAQSIDIAFAEDLKALIDAEGVMHSRKHCRGCLRAMEENAIALWAHHKQCEMLHGRQDFVRCHTTWSVTLESFSPCRKYLIIPSSGSAYCPTLESKVKEFLPALPLPASPNIANSSLLLLVATTLI